MASSAKTKANQIRALRARVAELEAENTRVEGLIGSAVWIAPGRMGGTPCIGGTRIPISTVIGMLEAGDDATLEAYPSLSRDQLDLARWYHATYADTDRTCRWPRPVIHVDPAVRFGRPMIEGVSCGVLAEIVVASEDIEMVAEEYGLNRAEVLLSCWFIGMDGPPEYQARWREWAEDAHAAMARGEYDQVSDPPVEASTEAERVDDA